MPIPVSKIEAGISRGSFLPVHPCKKDDIYQHFIKLNDIFPVHSSGIVTARDKLSIHFNKEDAFQLVSDFSSFKEEIARKVYNLDEDTRDWEVKRAQQDILDSGVDIKKIVPILFRPFDIRFTYYTGKSRGFMSMPRPAVMRHMLGENIGILIVRQVPRGAFNHCFVSDTIIESRTVTSNMGICYIFPLHIYLYPEKKNQREMFNLNQVFTGESIPGHSNINSNLFSLLGEIFCVDTLPSSEQIFYYIYAILFSNIYREKYHEHLIIEFPRIPFTPDYDLFIQLSSLGERLASIHLLKSMELDRTFSKFAVNGDNLVKKPLFKPAAGEDGRVYINDTQYFSNIRLELWEYYVGGYQVLKKWLMDRKNLKLSTGDIRNYIKMSSAIQLTCKYQEEIDGLYSQIEENL
jgi:predicted helicase